MGPPLTTVAVLTFLSVWNDFSLAACGDVIAQEMTVQLGLSTFQSAHFTDWPV
jgi:multiple sugar transport system permease protein